MRGHMGNKTELSYSATFAESKLAINLPTSTHCQIESSIHNVY